MVVFGSSACSSPLGRRRFFRRRCLRTSPADARLARILERTKDYCQKLERAALDFTCIEKIEERTYSTIEEAPDGVVPNPSGVAYTYKPINTPYYATTYVYDYQFVRKGSRKAESRVLIEENGRKKKNQDAVLTTSTVRVENALFGPIGLLGDAAQDLHEYRIVGEETEKGKKVLVLEATLKATLDRVHCTGRIWVGEDDASILKIAWDQTSVGNFEIIQETAERDECGAPPDLGHRVRPGEERPAVPEQGHDRGGLPQARPGPGPFADHDPL